MRVGRGKKYYYVEEGKIYMDIESGHPLDDERYAERNYYTTKDGASRRVEQYKRRKNKEEK